MRIARQIFILVVISAALMACNPQGTDSLPDESEDGSSEIQNPTLTPAEDTASGKTPMLEPSGPERIEFPALDGTILVGTFWPPAPSAELSPGILLLHWAPGSRADWGTLAALLQGVAIAGGTSNSAHDSFAVLAIDFRGHGESSGEQDRPANIADTLVALDVLRTLPGVDPDRIVLIGASIGADAAVDGCGQGCLGAISISPGGYLGVPYGVALGELPEKQFLCVTAENDTASFHACNEGQEVSLDGYQMQLYDGSSHGMALFDIVDQPPFLTDLIFAWLNENVPLNAN